MLKRLNPHVKPFSFEKEKNFKGQHVQIVLAVRFGLPQRPNVIVGCNNRSIVSKRREARALTFFVVVRLHLGHCVLLWVWCLSPGHKSD